MRVGVEDERARGAKVAFATCERPAGQNASKFGDVGLSVAAIHAERVQLHDFTREIFVEAPLGAPADRRIGTHRLRVVEKGEHRGMPLDRLQHVGEPAEHERADRLALEGAGAGSLRHAFGRRDAEMIGPEGDEPLDETDRRGASRRRPGRRLG